jgi:hypothetical protein
MLTASFSIIPDTFSVTELLKLSPTGTDLVSFVSDSLPDWADTYFKVDTTQMTERIQRTGKIANFFMIFTSWLNAGGATKAAVVTNCHHSAAVTVIINPNYSTTRKDDQQKGSPAEVDIQEIIDTTLARHTEICKGVLCECKLNTDD